MRTRSSDIDDDAVRQLVRASWGIPIGSLDYVPLGFGGHHWRAASDESEATAAWLVTVDDLDTKPWLGEDRAAALDGLRAAFRTALQLHDDAGLAFVVAPLATLDGDVLARLDDRHVVSVVPFVEGTAGVFGDLPEVGPDPEQVVAMLAQLHDSTPMVTGNARSRSSALQNRSQLLDTLDHLDNPWTSGPRGEAARALPAAVARAHR